LVTAATQIVESAAREPMKRSYMSEEDGEGATVAEKRKQELARPRHAVITAGWRAGEACRVAGIYTEG
jgi:hypothetical protein